MLFLLVKNVYVTYTWVCIFKCLLSEISLETADIVEPVISLELKYKKGRYWNKYWTEMLLLWDFILQLF